MSNECDLFTASCKPFLSLFLRQVRTHPALQFPGPMKLQKLPTSCHLKEVRTVGNGIAGAWTPLRGISFTLKAIIGNWQELWPSKLPKVWT